MVNNFGEERKKWFSIEKRNAARRAAHVVQTELIPVGPVSTAIMSITEMVAQSLKNRAEEEPMFILDSMPSIPAPPTYVGRLVEDLKKLSRAATAPTTAMRKMVNEAKITGMSADFLIVDEASALPTGWPTLDDRLTKGFRPGELSILTSGRMAGKSRFASTLWDTGGLLNSSFNEPSPFVIKPPTPEQMAAIRAAKEQEELEVMFLQEQREQLDDYGVW